jgi:hypothetical protein
MDLIKRATNGLNNLLKPTYNIREVIPGWDDDYPDSMFTDNWELTSELELDDDDDQIIPGWDWNRGESYLDDNWNLQEPRKLPEDSIFPAHFAEESHYWWQEEIDYLKKIDKCPRCKYWAHGEAKFICAVHPYGNENCPDFESEY